MGKTNQRGVFAALVPCCVSAASVFVLDPFTWVLLGKVHGGHERLL